MKKVKIIDSAFAHCNYSNNPLPPLQSCEWIEWDRTNINYNDTLFVTESHITNPQIHQHPGKKIAWLLECVDLQPNVYSWVLENYQKFTNVISHDVDFISKIPNGKWVPFGGCWVDKKDWNLYDKTKLVSIVASSKNYLKGHQLRHQIIEKYRNILDLYGGGYNPIKDKIESLKDYKYQIVIENSFVKGYFTEKLIDCFVTGTVPIYVGDPNIDNIFDSTGMIIVDGFESLDEVLHKIKEINYSQFENGLKNNFNISKDYILTEDYIYKNYTNLYE
jgi:hypothetical protein